MTTLDPNEVNFIVGLHKTEIQVGSYIPEYANPRDYPDYDDGVAAIRQGFTVEMIDLEKKAKVGTGKIWGLPPGQKIPLTGDSNKGKLPDAKAIVDYLMTLPYSP